MRLRSVLPLMAAAGLILPACVERGERTRSDGFNSDLGSISLSLRSRMAEVSFRRTGTTALRIPFDVLNQIEDVNVSELPQLDEILISDLFSDCEQSANWATYQDGRQIAFADGELPNLSREIEYGVNAEGYVEAISIVNDYLEGDGRSLIPEDTLPCDDSAE